MNDFDFILGLENKFHGFRTRLKELHFSAPSMSLHKLIDEFCDEFDEFDDAIMENAQAICGFIKPGDLSPELPDAMEMEDLLIDLRGIITSVKRKYNDAVMWTGIINLIDDFYTTINKYIYLVKITKKE